MSSSSARNEPGSISPTCSKQIGTFVYESKLKASSVHVFVPHGTLVSGAEAPDG
jgi:hypothetical protein